MEGRIHGIDWDTIDELEGVLIAPGERKEKEK